MEQAECCPHCFQWALVNGRCKNCGWDSEQLRLHPVEGALPPFTPLKNGTYQLGRALGAGGFGVTYIARCQQGDTRYAVKEYYPASCSVRENGGKRLIPVSDREGYEAGLEKFFSEAQTVSKLNREPYIVRVEDCFRENDTAYMVMEYVDGPNLSQYLQSLGSGMLPYDDALQMLTQVAMALQGVHGAGIVHRDISPENILRCRDGSVCLIDFGASRDYLHVSAGGMSVFLKKRFAPPEQYSNLEKQGPFTDFYALGATFYHMLTKKYVPPAPDRIAGQRYTPIPDIRQDVELSMVEILDKCLALNAADRYQTAAELVSDILNRTTVETASEQVPGPPPAPAEQVHGFYLELLSGPEGGTLYRLPVGQPIVVGRRAADCNVTMTGENISRQHFVVTLLGPAGPVQLEDISSNGTFFANGVRLAKGVPYPLKSEQLFYLVDRGHFVRVIYQ